MYLSAISGRRRRTASLPFGLSVGTAAFAVLVTVFAIPLLWVGFNSSPLGGEQSNTPDLTPAAEAQITAEALLTVCPECVSGDPIFVIETLYQSGSPLSDVVRPMTGRTAQSIAAAVPNAVFMEAFTDEAAAAYEEAGSRQTAVITLSPVTYPTATSATIFVGVIWGTSVTETPVVFQWNGSEWIYQEKLPACRRNSSDDPCQTS